LLILPTPPLFDTQHIYSNRQGGNPLELLDELTMQTLEGWGYCTAKIS